jgi:hypothetical protein
MWEAISGKIMVKNLPQANDPNQSQEGQSKMMGDSLYRDDNQKVYGAYPVALFFGSARV